MPYQALDWARSNSFPWDWDRIPDQDWVVDLDDGTLFQRVRTDADTLVAVALKEPRTRTGVGMFFLVPTPSLPTITARQRAG